MGNVFGGKGNSNSENTENTKINNCIILYIIIDCLPEKKGALFELKKDANSIDEALEFKYINKTQISHDTFIFTYEIENNLTLGLNLGHHIAIE
jgi:hypothetical protein